MKKTTTAKKASSPKTDATPKKGAKKSATIQTVPAKKSTPTASTKKTTRAAPTKKTTAPATKKSSPKKATPSLKDSPQTSIPVPAEKTPTKKSVKTPASKKAPKKTLPKESTTSSQSSSGTDSPLGSPLTTPQMNIRTIGILHFIGNLLSVGTLSILLMAIYLLLKNDTMDSREKETCYEIINFNITYLLYIALAFGSLFLIIGFILVPVVYISWFVLLIVGFLAHLKGENYKYPGIIRFIS